MVRFSLSKECCGTNRGEMHASSVFESRFFGSEPGEIWGRVSGSEPWQWRQDQVQSGEASTCMSWEFRYWSGKQNQPVQPRGIVTGFAKSFRKAAINPICDAAGAN